MNNTNADIQYIVDEKKRTIVAILTVPCTEIYDEIWNIINKKAESHFVIQKLIMSDRLALTGIYRGKAKAHPADEWNVDKGKNLARLRARRIYMKERKRIVKELKEIFNNIEDSLEKAIDFTNNVLNRIEENLQKTND